MCPEAFPAPEDSPRASGLPQARSPEEPTAPHFAHQGSAYDCLNNRVPHSQRLKQPSIGQLLESFEMAQLRCRLLIVGKRGKKKKLERVQIFFSGSLGKKWRVGVGEIIYSTSKKKRKRNRTLKSHYKQWGGSLCIDMGTWEGAAGERPRFTGKWETHTEKHCGRHNSFIRAVRLQVHIRI